jgi:hypothetical protein
MRFAISHGLTIVLSGVLFVGMLGWPAPTRAQLGTATVVTTGTTTTALADTGTLAAGSSNALDASALTGAIPAALLAGDVLHAATIGYPNQIDSEAALSDLSLGAAGTTIGADFVMARASEVLGTAGVASSEVDHLSINGIPVVVTGAPNQSITIPGGAVILNEHQTLPDGTVVVNALHITIPGVEDVVIATATAGASGGRAAAVRASF